MVKLVAPLLLRLAVIAAVSAPVALVAVLALALRADGQAPDGPLAGPYAGAADSRTIVERAIDAVAATTTPVPAIEVQTAEPTPSPSPAVLAATETPAPTEAPTPTAPPAEPVAQPQAIACPRYPILLAPTPDLAAATQTAAAMWDGYLGCTAFQVASGGTPVRRATEWPGPCLYTDIAACTVSEIILSPAEPQYQPAGVIAHELGHLLNVPHGAGPAIMDPANWNGAATAWCSLDAWCE